MNQFIENNRDALSTISSRTQNKNANVSGNLLDKKKKIGNAEESEGSQT